MINLGNRIYGAAAVALGLVGLAWGDFAAVWQPVPDAMPGRTALAYAAALLFIAGGAALQLGGRFGSGAKAGAVLLAALYTVFTLLWARRVIGYPQIFGTWSGCAEELALVIGGLMAYAFLLPAEGQGARRLAVIGRLVFGLCLVAFGAAHFLYVAETAALVPAWIPPGPRAWALITGACHLLAGLALLSGLQARLAARLVTAMFIGFGLLVWLPQLFSAPHEHMAWAGNAINFALIGAAWAVADAIARFGSGRGALRSAGKTEEGGESG
jgi:uncharacterized membrane protein YphA (DoxX/SURF4 family)